PGGAIPPHVPVSLRPIGGPPQRGLRTRLRRFGRGGPPAQKEHPRWGGAAPGGASPSARREPPPPSPPPRGGGRPPTPPHVARAQVPSPARAAAERVTHAAYRRLRVPSHGRRPQAAPGSEIPSRRP